MKKVLLLSILALFVFQHHESFGQKLPFQGRLLENGTPVNTLLPMDFSIPDVSWSESHTNVNVENGLYSVVLGSVNPLPANLFEGVSERSLNITVNGTALTAVKIYPAITQPLTFGTPSNQIFLDSVSVVDGTNRKAVVIKSSVGGNPTTEINGYGSNGKRNFTLQGSGDGNNYGHLMLDNASGAVKAWMAARQHAAGSTSSSGYFALSGPTAGQIRLGFKDWEAPGNMPFIALDGTTAHESRVWIDVYKDATTGVESGTINLSSSDGRSLHINPSTQFGYPANGPTTENFLMTGKDWEGKGDYPLFELRGTINSMADGTGYTLPLAGINTSDDGIREWGSIYVNSGAIGGTTVDNRIALEIHKDGAGNELGALSLRSSTGKTLHIDANTQLGYPANGPTTENFLMTGKDWEGKGDYPIFELRGTIQSLDGYTLPLAYTSTTDDGVHEWATMGINAGQIGSSSAQNMLDLHVRKSANGISGAAVFRGQSSDNVIIGSADWEVGGADRGTISILGNSQRAGDGGGSYNPALFHMHVGTDVNGEIGGMRIENQAGNVNVDLNAGNDGIIVVRNGVGEVVISGNGDINATGIITASNVSNTSDRRYKENIVGLESSLQNMLKLRGVSYYWKDKAKSSRRQIGLIAQEVEEVYPEFVHTDANGYKSVNYSAMVAVLIEAVKELENKVETLEKENSTLSSENASLKTSLKTEMDAIHQRMNQMETLLNIQSQQASAGKVATDGSGK